MRVLNMYNLNTSNLRGDIMGGITTGIVALPLALAFGEASGAGPMAGLYGAIIVGFLASLFGGTGSNISGPTGPMVVVFAGVYTTLGGNPELVFIGCCSGGTNSNWIWFLKDRAFDPTCSLSCGFRLYERDRCHYCGSSISKAIWS